MRIDYSPPKTSCSTASSPVNLNRPRTESSGGVFVAALISGLVCLIIGFGSGWMLSQRSTKEAFRKALEQQSLENSPQQAKVKPSQSPQPAAVASPSAPQTSQTTGPAPQSAQPSGAEKPGDPPLSFYKTLPSNQKSNVMGSGINVKDEKPAKQPLQAAMPTNMTKPVQADNDDTAAKQPAPVAPGKPASRQETNSLTVQVASYSLKSAAEEHRVKLAAKGYDVRIVESHVKDNGTWYRVWVGKRLDPAAAKDLSGKLGRGTMVIPDKE